jgi:hypothetical protein
MIQTSVKKMWRGVSVEYTGRPGQVLLKKKGNTQITPSPLQKVKTSNLLLGRRI